MMQKSLHTDDDIDRVLQQYANLVYRIAYSQTQNKSDADDIFQEVFLQYIKRHRVFESSEHEKAWLIRVTINFCKKLWNSAWFRHTVGFDQEMVFEMPEENDITHALAQLPPIYRSVIYLFYYEDMSVAQISEVLSMKESAVRTRLTRARELLRTKLKGDFDYV